MAASLISLNSNDFWLAYVITRPELKGHGLGTEVVAASLRTLDAPVFGGVTDGNTPSERLLTIRRHLRGVAGVPDAVDRRHRISHRLFRFYTVCADSGVAELERLAHTVQTWWPQIEAFLHTGITNATPAKASTDEDADASTPLNFDEHHPSVSRT